MQAHSGVSHNYTGKTHVTRCIPPWWPGTQVRGEGWAGGCMLMIVGFATHSVQPGLLKKRPDASRDCLRSGDRLGVARAAAA
jgi:hypothetical protein